MQKASGVFLNPAEQSKPSSAVVRSYSPPSDTGPDYGRADDADAAEGGLVGNAARRIYSAGTPKWRAVTGRIVRGARFRAGGCTGFTP
jgi:hypothetical protein